jgi:hypothetical protein
VVCVGSVRGKNRLDDSKEASDTKLLQLNNSKGLSMENILYGFYFNNSNLELRKNCKREPFGTSSVIR